MRRVMTGHHTLHAIRSGISDGPAPESVIALNRSTEPSLPLVGTSDSKPYQYAPQCQSSQYLSVCRAIYAERTATWSNRRIHHVLDFDSRGSSYYPRQIQAVSISALRKLSSCRVGRLTPLADSAPTRPETYFPRIFYWVSSGPISNRSTVLTSIRWNRHIPGRARELRRCAATAGAGDRARVDTTPQAAAARTIPADALDL
jgi:hypothetical protein